jgi:glycosyltransferase involved in cell wall biosynthesis
VSIVARPAAQARFLRHDRPLLSVVVPAHDEEAVLGRTLTALLQDAQEGEIEVVVVCNGCTDSTQDVAERFGRGVQVRSTSRASKTWALDVGDHAVTAFPRLYLDADVSLDTDSARALAAAVRGGTVHAAGPERVVDREDRPWLVRAFYDVWEELPAAQDGLHGRGAIAVNETGHRRLSPWPEVLADDLFVSRAFSPHERTVVPAARVRICAPRTTRDLLRRRVRLSTGNAQQAAGYSADRNGPADLWRLIRRQPRRGPDIVVFLLLTAVARWRSRQMLARGHATWLRDESSRR